MKNKDTEEMFRELSIRGYYLCYLDDEWCFGNDFSDIDDFPLALLTNKDKYILIQQGYTIIQKTQ